MIKVLVVSEIRLFCEGLEEILGRTENFRVLGSIADANSAVRYAEKLHPDVVLLDMAIHNSIDVGQGLRQSEVCVVALGIPEQEDTIIACASIGINGYVCRSASLTELCQALTGVARGEVYCDAPLAAVALRCIGSAAHGPARSQISQAAPALTRREMQIASLLGEGLSNKQIARRLCIEVSTVKNHVHNILTKLGAQNRAEASTLLPGLTGSR